MISLITQSSRQPASESYQSYHPVHLRFEVYLGFAVRNQVPVADRRVVDNKTRKNHYYEKRSYE